MNIWGIIFMFISWGLILFLVFFSFVRVLGQEGSDRGPE